MGCRPAALSGRLLFSRRIAPREGTRLTPNCFHLISATRPEDATLILLATAFSCLAMSRSSPACLGECLWNPFREKRDLNPVFPDGNVERPTSNAERLARAFGHQLSAIDGRTQARSGILTLVHGDDESAQKLRVAVGKQHVAASVFWGPDVSVIPRKEIGRIPCRAESVLAGAVRRQRRVGLHMLGEPETAVGVAQVGVAERAAR